MRPTNSSILIEPLPESEQVGGGVKTPESALFLAKGKVLDLGNHDCIIDGVLISKPMLIPGLEIGKIVHYVKIAEDRLDVDAAYRVKTGDSSYALIVRIQDIRGIE